MIALLVRSQLRFAMRHPVGPVASLLGVVLAVLAVVVVHLVGLSIRDDLNEPSLGGHTHVASRASLAEADYFALRAAWRRGELGEQRIEAMFPVIEGYVRVGGEPVRIIGFDAMAVGGFLAGASPGGGIQTVTPTRQQAGLDRFLIDDVVLASTDTAQAIARDDGILGGIPVDVIQAETGIVADLPTAQRLLGRPGEIDAVWLRATGTRTGWLDRLDRVLPGIAAGIPEAAGLAIDGYTVTPESRWNPSRRFADAITFNLGMLSLLCLLMAGFIAFQASASNAARRRTERDRLLAIGVSRASLRGVACAEGLVLGALGAAVGIGLGALIADALLQLRPPDPAGQAAQAASGAALDAWIVGKGLACGILVSCIGPLAEGTTRTSPRMRLGLGLLAVALAGLALAHGSLAGAFLALAAVCAVQIVDVVPATAWAVRRFAIVGKSLALRSTLRAAETRSDENRLALGALSVAAAVAMGMGLMVESLRMDFTDMLDVRLGPGLYIDAESDVAAAEADAIRDLPGVRDVRRYGDFSAGIQAGRVAVRLAELDASETARYGFDGPLPDGAMMNEVGARRFGIDPGETVTLASGGAAIPVEVAHVFRDFGAAAPRVILPMTFLPRVENAAVRWQRVSVTAEPDAVAPLAASLGQRFGADRIRNQYDIRALALAVFDRSFAVSRSLTVVTLLVAAIGLYAALTALQAGRAHEYRLLSAVGRSRAQLWRGALAETVVLGTIALVAAVPLGLAMAWVLCSYVNPAAFGWSIDLHLDFAPIAEPLLFGLVAALAAGAVPAYRASYRGVA